MTEVERNLALYNMLVQRALAMNLAVPVAHNSLFHPTEETPEFNQILYYDQQGLDSTPRRRPGVATCKYCEKFHLSNLKNINKANDVLLGNKLEQCFQGFIEDIMGQVKIGQVELSLSCERADSKDFHMPDFKIVRSSDNKAIMYFEFKVIFRPFIKISQMVNSDWECYSNSLTLDLENGKKLREQRDRVEDSIGIDNVIYVYWYDLPCVKGIFWLSAGQVYNIMGEQMPYDRKNVAGDYNTYGRKNAATKKLYLPLTQMSDLISLVKKIRSLYQGT